MGKERDKKVRVTVNVKKTLLVITLLTSCFQLMGCSAKEEEQVETESASLNDFIDNPVEYVSKEFKFNAPKVKGKVEVAEPAESTKTITLYLDDSVYYPVEVPFDLEIVTDNSKYIYAKDNSLNVSVMSNTPHDNFSDFVAIKEPEAITPYLIRGVEKKNKPQEAAKKIVNDKAIVVRGYNNPVAFETVFESLVNNSYKVTDYVGLIPQEDVTEELNTLPLYKDYHYTIDSGLVDEIQKVYSFDDGSLTIAREFLQMPDAINSIGTKVAIIDGNPVPDKVYQSDKVYYAERGDYTVGVASINFNTSITLFGSGKEARYNIVRFLSE